MGLAPRADCNGTPGTCTFCFRLVFGAVLKACEFGEEDPEKKIQNGQSCVAVAEACIGGACITLRGMG